MNSYIPLAADGLGTPVGEYRRSWIGALLGWGGGTAGMATALWFSYNSDTGTWWTALVFGLFSLMLLGATIWSTYTAATERVLLFSDGMFHQKRLAGDRYRWVDIKRMERSISQQNGVYYVVFQIILFDDKECVFDGSFFRIPRGQPRTGLFQQFSLIEAVMYVEEAAGRALVQKAISQYDSGADVEFDVLCVNQRGIHTKNESLYWAEITDIDQNAQELLVFGHQGAKPRLVIPIKKMVNPFVFGALLHHIDAKKWTLNAEPEVVVEQPFGKEARRRRWAKISPWLWLLLIFGLNWGYGRYHYAQSPRGQVSHGIHLANDQRYAEAITVFDPVIVENPTYTNAYLHRGRAYHKLNQFDQAMRDYQQALMLQPGDWYSIYNRGRLYDEMNQYEAAFRDYAQAIALKPDFNYSYYKRGNLYKRLGMNNQAISDLEKYLTFKDSVGNHAAVKQTLRELRR